MHIPTPGRLYNCNCHKQGRLCRRLSIPFTENVLGEQCFLGRSVHDFSQTQSTDNVACPCPARSECSLSSPQRISPSLRLPASSSLRKTPPRRQQSKSRSRSGAG